MPGTPYQDATGQTLSDFTGTYPNVNQWEIICGGGDPYQVADAIYKGMPDFSALVGSTLAVTTISSTNPAVVTTDLNHGYSSGQTVVIY